MMKFSPQPLCGSNLFKYSLLSFMILNAHAAYADEATLQKLVKTPSQAEQVTVPLFYAYQGVPKPIDACF